VLKNIIKNNYKVGFLFTSVFMLFLSDPTKSSLNNIFSLNFTFSFIMYFGFFIIAIHGFKNYGILGVYLLITIFFIPPSIFPEYRGLLFPITYLSFISYLGFIISKEYFKYWKNGHGL
tara:strand:- start:353 stop:706 length:354 start_codon:yes stop_codon:yes gene_type:complete